MNWETSTPRKDGTVRHFSDGDGTIKDVLIVLEAWDEERPDGRNANVIFKRVADGVRFGGAMFLSYEFVNEYANWRDTFVSIVAKAVMTDEPATS